MFLYVAVFFVTCFAHSRWVYPEKRPGELNRFGGVKTGPCGNIAPSDNPTVLQPGWTTLQFEETIGHTGSPWRISLGLNGGVEDGFEDCILLNHIPHNDARTQGQGFKQYKISVFIPDVQCNNCVLQLANPMTDKIQQATYCDYDKTKLEQCNYGQNCEQGVCFSNYHSCADVIISGTQPRNTFQCSQPAEWPFQAGSLVQLPCNHNNCRGQTTRDDYTQISVNWQSDFIIDARVPAVFSTDFSVNPPQVVNSPPELPTTLPDVTTTLPETTFPGVINIPGVTGGTNPSNDSGDDNESASSLMIIIPLVIIVALIGVAFFYFENIKAFFDSSENDSDMDMEWKQSIVAPVFETRTVSKQLPPIEWFFVDAGEQSVGPLSQKEFEAVVGLNVLDNTLVWNESMANWMPAREIPSVSEVLNLKMRQEPVSPDVMSDTPIPPFEMDTPAPSYPTGTALAPDESVPKPVVGNPATANVEWQYVNSNAEAVVILEKDLLRMNLDPNTYVWNGITVNDWTYLRDTYLFQLLQQNV